MRCKQLQMLFNLFFRAINSTKFILYINGTTSWMMIIGLLFSLIIKYVCCFYNLNKYNLNYG